MTRPSQRGTFRIRGDNVDIYPSHYEDRAWRVTLFGDDIETHRGIRPADRRAQCVAR